MDNNLLVFFYLFAVARMIHFYSIHPFIHLGRLQLVIKIGHDSPPTLVCRDNGGKMNNRD